MNKTDAIIAMGIGAVTGLYFFDLLKNAASSATGQPMVPEPFYSLLWSIIPIFTVMAAIGLWVASLIGKKYLSIYQLAKFLLVGVLATIFDLGALNILMGLASASSGPVYVFLKGLSFIISTVVKYIPDKYWAFKKKETSNVKKEFIQFFAVTLTGLIINLSVAHAIVNIIGPQFGLDAKSWGNLGGIGATIITFAWNFIGYKFIVFKK
ncbi:MAG: GtrA family protein [Candidatus Paceibacterota bacterium]